MKRVILIAALMFTSATALISCRDTTERETVIREVEVERTEPVKVEVEEKEREGVFERSAKKVDEKINKEIDEEIDRIGDDN